MHSNYLKTYIVSKGVYLIMFMEKIISELNDQ